MCHTAQVAVIGQLGEYVLLLLPCGFWGTELRYLGTLACYTISLALASPLFFRHLFPFQELPLCLPARQLYPQVLPLTPMPPPAELLCPRFSSSRHSLLTLAMPLWLGCWAAASSPPELRVKMIMGSEEIRVTEHPTLPL